MKKLIAAMFLAFAAVGCTNDSTSDLIDDPNDIVITYNENVKTIIDNNCIVCHAATPVNGAPMSLTTYQNVKDAVQTRGLLDRISRAQGESGMMPNGGTRLPQHQIDIIAQWSAQGLLE